MGESLNIWKIWLRPLGPFDSEYTLYKTFFLFPETFQSLDSNLGPSGWEADTLPMSYWVTLKNIVQTLCLYKSSDPIQYFALKIPEISTPHTIQTLPVVVVLSWPASRQQLISITRVVWMACLSELPPLLYVVTLFLMIKKRIRFLPFIFDPATLYQNFACFTWFWKNWTSISGWLWILRLYWNWGNNHRNSGWFCFASWHSAAEAKVC